MPKTPLLVNDPMRFGVMVALGRAQLCVLTAVQVVVVGALGCVQGTVVGRVPEPVAAAVLGNVLTPAVGVVGAHALLARGHAKWAAQVCALMGVEGHDNSMGVFGDITKRHVETA